jgi:hypothetical protein
VNRPLSYVRAVAVAMAVAVVVFFQTFVSVDHHPIRTRPLLF